MQRVPLKNKEDGRVFRLRLAETADPIPALLALAAQPAVTEQSQFIAADCLAGQDALGNSKSRTVMRWNMRKHDTFFNDP
jgi:hypothetical protein